MAGCYLFFYRTRAVTWLAAAALTAADVSGVKKQKKRCDGGESTEQKATDATMLKKKKSWKVKRFECALVDRKDSCKYVQDWHVLGTMIFVLKKDTLLNVHISY